MRDDADNAAVLFPGALGDFLCWLPALCALRRRHGGRLLVAARPSLLELIDLTGSTLVSIDRREIADLFAGPSPPKSETRALFEGSSHVYSWTGHGDPNFAERLATASGGAPRVYPFRDMQPGEHATDYYCRCISAVSSLASPELLVIDRSWLAGFLQRHGLGAHRWLLIHAGSGAARKNWRGFAELAAAWRARYAAPVVVLIGPAEADTILDTDVVVRDIALPRVAALLKACDVFVGNDSGVSHLAAVVGAHGTVLFGPTDPTTWAPCSQHLRVLHAPTPCTTCGPDIFCTHRLRVARVLQSLEAADSSGSS
jgi:hypothetical protein